MSSDFKRLSKVKAQTFSGEGSISVNRWLSCDVFYWDCGGTGRSMSSFIWWSCSLVMKSILSLS